MAITRPTFEARTMAGEIATWSTNTTIDFGTGSNRRVIVVARYYNATTPRPGASITIGGTDTISAVTSAFQGPSNNWWRVYEGALTVTGSQNVTGTNTDSTGSEGGGTQIIVLVRKGDGAITFGNLTSTNNAAAGSGTFDRSLTVTTTSGDIATWFGVEKNETPTVTAVSGTTQVSGSGVSMPTTGGMPWAGIRTASGSSTSVGFEFAGAQEIVYFGFTDTEAGGQSNAPRAHYYRMLQTA